MSKGLNTTIALGGTMLAVMALGTGVSAQSAGQYGTAAGELVVEWNIGAQGPVTITIPGEQRTQRYREAVQERNQPMSAIGMYRQNAKSVRESNA